MNNNSWFKKERPLLSLQGFGGGSVGPLMGGASSPTIEATGGFIGEYTSGDYIYRTHTFTCPGSLVVSSVVGDGEIEYIVVGGGGAAGMGRHDSSTPSPFGGYHVYSSGGGGGGVRTNVPGSPISADNPITVSGPATYSVTVGQGGMSGTGHSKASWGRRGHDSVFSHPTNPIRADGGGGGLGKGEEPTSSEKTGGSGGGGGQEHPTNNATPFTYYPGGAGNTPPYTPPQGNAGGNSFKTALPNSANIGFGGGGGGAGGAGSGGGPDCSGGDGIGLTIEDGSTTVYYGGGGAGGSNPAPNPNAFGGKCGPEPPSPSYQYTTSAYDLGFGSGGTGPQNPSSNVIDMVTRSGKQGVQGYGGGGGGTSDYGCGGQGGWGCVVIRYKIAEQTGTAKATGGIINYYPGSPLSPTGAVIHIFRGPGNFVTPPTFNETCEYVVIGGGGCGGTRGGGGGGAGGFVTATTPVGGGQDCGVYVGMGGCGRDPGYIWAGSGPTGTDYVSAGIGQGTNSFAAFPAGTVTAGGGGAGGGDMRAPTPSGYSPYGVVPNPVASAGGASPTGTAAGTGGPQGNDGGEGYPTYGGGGGGAGGAGEPGVNAPTPYGGKGGSGLQLPATFRNPTMATPTGEIKSGGGLGFPGPGGGSHYFAGGGGGGSSSPLPGTGYGSYGGGPTASVQNSKVGFPNSSFMSFGWTGAGSGRGPLDVSYVPSPTYALNQPGAPWSGGYGGPAAANSGSGGGAGAKEGISTPGTSYAPSEPLGGTGGSGIVLIAYPQ